MNLSEPIRLCNLPLSLPQIRALEARGDFIPIEWSNNTKKRSGWVWREDWETWKEGRFERARLRRIEAENRRDYIADGELSSAFDFLKEGP